VSRRIQEGALFMLGQYGLEATQLSAENYTSFLEFSFGSAADLVAQHYPLSAFNFTELPPVFLAISTIITIHKCFLQLPGLPSLELVVQNGIPVWTYQWAHVSSCTWWNILP
jgi:hypothetical protein